MNGLIQLESTIIGTEEAVAELGQKQSARLLVISDTHGEYELLKHIVIEFGADVDAFIFCGDGFCDVAALIEEAWTNPDLREVIPPVIISARGNGDGEKYSVKVPAEELEEKYRHNDYRTVSRQLCTVAGRNLLVVHGHRHGVDFGTETLASSAYTLDADMVLFGHTHRSFWEESEGTLILNPGSVSRPRGGMPPTFALLSFPGEIERYRVEYFKIEEGIFSGISFSPLSLPAN